MLSSVQKLYNMGYKLFATSGTADFLSEHGIAVQYLEVLNKDDDDQKSEYSLTQHLANNEIDLYINFCSLPTGSVVLHPMFQRGIKHVVWLSIIRFRWLLTLNVQNC